jgi:hypothetical protein
MWLFILIVLIIFISLYITLIDIKIEVLQDCIIIRYTNLFNGIRHEKIFRRKET